MPMRVRRCRSRRCRTTNRTRAARTARVRQTPGRSLDGNTVTAPCFRLPRLPPDDRENGLRCSATDVHQARIGNHLRRRRRTSRQWPGHFTQRVQRLIDLRIELNRPGAHQSLQQTRGASKPRSRFALVSPLRPIPRTTCGRLVQAPATTHRALGSFDESQTHHSSKSNPRAHWRAD